MIAALFVEKGGVYFGLEGVDPWPEERDARKYAGPHPVVAHPVCGPWGKLAGLVESKGGRKRKDDGGSFASALKSVRTWGGVLEHPEGSAAWREFGLRAPDGWGGWSVADFFGGWTCCVEQGHYGHAAPKRTWLYMVGDLGPPVGLKWGPSGKTGRIELMDSKSGERSRTPIPFRDLLISIARTARGHDANCGTLTPESQGLFVGRCNCGFETARRDLARETA